ncbi:hypothetical protein [Aquibacillus kalidii]|uniref:hypothetical protein n=1 Tax=Aquibacillus kalidii TaxID=2762597 RepID=UPI001644D6F1|nr:hypothetical protein [Aquibacillus kalidii]
MDVITDAMKLPVDNLLGMLLYALIYMLITGGVVVVILKFIPISYGFKNAILGVAVFLSLYMWWITIIK